MGPQILQNYRLFAKWTITALLTLEAQVEIRKAT